jgi:hypothetical protein
MHRVLPLALEYQGHQDPTLDTLLANKTGAAVEAIRHKMHGGLNTANNRHEWDEWDERNAKADLNTNHKEAQITEDAK